MSHGDAWEGKWRGNWRMDWVTSTPHTTSEHGVSSITTADAQTPAASSRLNWRPCCFKWTRPFRRKTKSGFCACAITFQTQSTSMELEITVAWSHCRLKAWPWGESRWLKATTVTGGGGNCGSFNNFLYALMCAESIPFIPKVSHDLHKGTLSQSSIV
jgi:hypothetical protein